MSGAARAHSLEAIAQEFLSVSLAGLDLSREMLGVAKRKLPAHIRLVAGQAERLPFPSHSFDIIVSCNSFHYWRKPTEALREFARVLRPQGRLAITDWCDDYLSCRACDFLLRIFSRSHFKTYSQAECAALLEQAGFGHIRVERYKINWLWGLMTATAGGQPRIDMGDGIAV